MYALTFKTLKYWEPFSMYKKSFLSEEIEVRIKADNGWFELSKEWKLIVNRIILRQTVT